MSGGDFEKSLQEYVTSVEQFVQTMHDGLSELSAREEPTPVLSEDLDAASVARLEEAERQVAEKLEVAEPAAETVTEFEAQEPARNEELDRISTELESKTAEVRSLITQLEAIKAESEAKTAELEEKNLELIEATSALGQKSSEREQALASDLADRSLQLESHIAALRAKEEEIVRLQAQVAEFAQRELERAEQPHDTQDLNEIVELRNQVAELEALRSQVTELKTLETEAAGLREQAQKVAGLEARIAELEEQLARAEKVRPLSSVANVFASTAEDESEDFFDETTPSAPAPVRTRRATPKPTVKFTTTKKVLVVESTEIHRVLFGRYFQGLPIEIRFARNSTEADQLQSQSSFDLVVTDWNAQLKQGLPKNELIERVLSRLEA